MRQRFDIQLKIGQTPISNIYINPKGKHALDQLIAALKEIYCNPEYNDRIFSIIEKYLPDVDLNNGRPGMNLWTVFVLGQVRLCLGESYCTLHNLANNHRLLRQLIGIEDTFGIEPFTFEYQNIYDNVRKLSSQMLSEINDVIVEFGHREVFKKKETTPLSLKTDSFVVESNVHFPTDYNLLWDCCRKCLDTMDYFRGKYPYIDGWRKIRHWYSDIKSKMRTVGRISSGGGKHKQEKLQKATSEYLEKCTLLLHKIITEKNFLPVHTVRDIEKYLLLEEYTHLLVKHIDLLDRRVMKGEKIPHEEKMISIFETYTEWIVKGKFRPSVELGKKLSITTDQFNLIVHYKIMDHEQDRDIVVEIVKTIMLKYKLINSISLDKGHWNADNKSLLEKEIPNVILPKLGRRTIAEKELEESPKYKILKNKHSAIESNINELEHRGLNRCPDRSDAHFSTYITMGVCAYNLKKIGKKILENQLKELLRKRAA